MIQNIYKIALFLFAISLEVAFTQNQPSQPSSGPGGSVYPYSAVIKHDFNPALSAKGYWMFEPTNPKPDSANVVVFNHGYGVYNPGPYGDWIEHLVKKGNIVIFPRYQYNLAIPSPSSFTDNASKAIRDALVELTSNMNYVQPRVNNFTIVGHSYGGVISSNLATEYTIHGIPKPKAIMLCMPGTGGLNGGRLSTYNNIDTSIKILSIIGENDVVVGDTFGKEMYNTTNNPVTHKNLILLKKDNYGSPRVRAGHNICLAPNRLYDGGTSGSVITGAYVEGETDVVDFYCFWKLADALIDCSIYGTNCNYAFGDTPNQRSMGNWSDNNSIVPLDITPKAIASIGKVNVVDFNIYPNPTNGKINLSNKLLNKNLFFKIVNILGKDVYTGKVTNNIILPNHIKNGVFYLVLYSKQEKYRAKIMLQK